MKTISGKQNMMHATMSPDHQENKEIFEDEFISKDNLVNILAENSERQAKRVLSDIEELISARKWNDAIALYYPVEKRLPELVETGRDMEVRRKIAFVLGKAKKYDEAIRELKICLKADPDNFILCSSLAYTAYDSLFAAAKREIVLTGQNRADRISLAAKNFSEACRLRPDSVTNYYRHGMLLKSIEKKSQKASPLFEKAVANWESLDDAQREKRHQERKNYIKALYQYAACRLDADDTAGAIAAMKKCLSEDEQTGYLPMVHKYFALGKIHFHGGAFDKARDALKFSISCGRQERKPIDYVYELLARTYLALNRPDLAKEIIEKEPEKHRRAYYRWTEADVYCALEDFDRAAAILQKSLSRDNRSRHKTLIKLARIAYLRRNFKTAAGYCEDANKFFMQKWGNPCKDALFWGALSALRSGDTGRAARLAKQLQDINPFYPRLGALMREIRAGREQDMR